jgi:hypothetical protein
LSEEEITLTRQQEAPPKSLAMMLKGQYISKELNDIYASTELRETEIIGLAGIFSTRFVSLIMSTTKEDKEGLKGAELKNIEERLAIKRRFLGDPNAMAFAIQDSFMYGFGLGRQSLKRQSRKEAMQIATSPKTMTGTADIGLKDKLFSKLGVSRKYQSVYVERE